MAKQTIFVLLLILLVNGCITPSSEKQELANPASVYCIEHGGTLRMAQNEEGEYGICTLANGTECEEWAYFRGECGKKV